MSILIKGMKMPGNCGECAFCRAAIWKGKEYPCVCLARNIIVKPSETDMRDGLCPLLPVPDHGDVVQVVRCKNCKWWGLSEYNTFGIHVCKKFSGVRGESDYCSRAERSEE